jgi:hypothetical protein
MMQPSSVEKSTRIAVSNGGAVFRIFIDAASAYVAAAVQGYVRSIKGRFSEKPPFGAAFRSFVKVARVYAAASVHR